MSDVRKTVTDLQREFDEAQTQVRLLRNGSEIAWEDADPNYKTIARSFLAAVKRRDALGERLRKATGRA